MAYESFVFYASFYEALRELDADNQIKAYTALFEYALYGTEPDCSGIVAAIFKLMRPQIDANNKRRESGERGGKSKQTPSKSKQTPSKPQASAKQIEASAKQIEASAKQIEASAKQSEANVNVNVNVNDNVNDNVDILDDAPADAVTSKPQKHKHGSCGNVLLTDDELERLKAEYPDWQDRIERLSEYMAYKGTAYKSHYMTIKAWARKDITDGKAPPGKPDYTDPSRYENMDMKGFREARDDEFTRRD